MKLLQIRQYVRFKLSNVVINTIIIPCQFDLHNYCLQHSSKKYSFNRVIVIVVLQLRNFMNVASYIDSLLYCNRCVSFNETFIKLLLSLNELQANADSSKCQSIDNNLHKQNLNAYQQNHLNVVSIFSSVISSIISKIILFVCPFLNSFNLIMPIIISNIYDLALVSFNFDHSLIDLVFLLIDMPLRRLFDIVNNLRTMCPFHYQINNITWMKCQLV